MSPFVKKYGSFALTFVATLAWWLYCEMPTPTYIVFAAIHIMTFIMMFGEEPSDEETFT
jgi:hypothetical protein